MIAVFIGKDDEHTTTTIRKEDVEVSQRGTGKDRDQSIVTEENEEDFPIESIGSMI